MHKRRGAKWMSSFFGKVSKNASAVMDSFEWMFHRMWEGIGNLFGSVASLLYPRALVKKIRRKQADRAIEKTEPGRQTAIGKSIETLEYIFHRLIAGVAKVGQLCYQIFVPTKLIASTEQKVAERASDALWSFRQALKTIGERFAPKWLTTRVGRLYDACIAVFLFMGAWLQTRDIRRLAWAVPALLLAAVMSASVAYSLVYTRVDKIRHYQATLASAIDSRDSAKEELCFAKLSQLGFQRTVRAEYASALALAEEPGQLKEAIDRMKRIASLEAPGFAPAHLWLAATQAIDDELGDERWERVRIHAEHALTASTRRDFLLRESARALLVDVAIHQQRINDAVQGMHELAKTVPLMQVNLMQYYASTNEITIAKRYARHVDTLMQIHDKQAGEDSERPDNARPATWAGSIGPEHYLAWAQAKRLLGSSAAIRVLERGIERFPDDEPLRIAAIESLAPKLRSTATQDPQLMPMIRRVLQLDSCHPLSVELVVSKVSEDSQTWERVLGQLRKEQLVSANLVGRLGDAAAGKQDFKKAMELYSEAVQLDPKHARVWNNMAWIYGNVEPTDLERALGAASKAIQIKPEPRFFETRGQILKKLQRWPQAIDDLRRALNGNLPDSIPTHEALAVAYDAMGNQALAQAHRSIVEAER